MLMLTKCSTDIMDMCKGNDFATEVTFTPGKWPLRFELCARVLFIAICQ